MEAFVKRAAEAIKAAEETLARAEAELARRAQAVDKAKTDKG